jgi:hypothetical protein
MKWICLVCEKELIELHPSPPVEKATWPNIEGGTIQVNFGYGSAYDDGLNPIEHHACICDECWEKKKHLTRAVEVERCLKWKELPPNYQDDSNW